MTTLEQAEAAIRAALDAGPTPGPWRWEFNANSKDVSLVGGRIRYDVTVMDFVRWGMGGAQPRFVEPTDIPNGLQLLHKLSDRKDWIAPFPEREHHADWCAQVTHPDARWMQEANPAALSLLLDELDRLRRDLSAVSAERDTLVTLAKTLRCELDLLQRERDEALEEVKRWVVRSALAETGRDEAQTALERERFARQEAQRDTDKAREERNAARLQGERDARRTLKWVVDDAVRAEREACAQVCDAYAKETWGFTEQEHTAKELAQSIRARATTSKESA